MLNKINKLYNFIFYIISLFLVIAFTYSFFSFNNQYINIIVDSAMYLLNYIYFLYIYLLIYVVVKTLAFLERLFTIENDTFIVKVDKGEIKLKADTLNRFVADSLLKNPLIEKVKVNSYGRKKVTLDILVYTYNVSDISAKLMKIQDDLYDEIEKTLSLNTSNINIVIANLAKASEEFVQEAKVEEESKIETEEITENIQENNEH